MISRGGHFLASLSKTGEETKAAALVFSMASHAWNHPASLIQNAGEALNDHNVYHLSPCHFGVVDFG